MISLKTAATLLTPKGRKEHGMFIVEGQKLIDEAIGAGYTLKATFNKDDVGDKAFAKLCDTVTPQGVAAVFDLKEKAENKPSEHGKYILLENIQNPQNVGAIIRSAEAMGLTGVIFCGTYVDIFSPKVLRGSMGSSLRVNCMFCENAKEAAQRIKEVGLKLYAATLSQDALPINKIKIDSGVVAIGNEGAGLTEELIALSDGALIIPMAGATESLSAQVAAAIIMWELFWRGSVI